LFNEHRRRLLAVVRQRLSPALSARVDPEDVLNQAFLTALRKWGRARPAGEPFPWLYQIVLDCVIEAWRRETRPCRNPARDVPWPDHSSCFLGQQPPWSDTSPSEALAREEENQAREQVLTQALQQLPPRDKEVVVLRHYGALPFKEVARQLNMTPTAAAVRYVRALKRLRRSVRDLENGTTRE
jgi:RNA polymerase sigma-70 factor (ECF subfamily)